MIPVTEEHPLIQLAPFRQRAQFGRFLNTRRLTGVAVEIGTDRGYFAYELMRTWNGRKLFCVDPWTHGYDKNDPASQRDRGSDYREAVIRLSQFGEKIEIVQKTSVDASRDIPDVSLEFVYIDGCHQYESVREDIATWWPKLKKNGILAGHDFVCMSNKQGGWGRYTQPAVLNHAIEYDIPVWMVSEKTNRNWSWYMVKP